MTDLAKVGAARAFAERVLGPIVFSRHVPVEFGGGKLFVSGKVGGMKYLFKRAHAWDPELLRVTSALVKRNDTVWDIGANVGLFAKSAAYLAGPEGRVIAIEPDTDAQVLLNRTFAVREPEEATVIVVPVAVSDHVGWETFSISMRARASNSLLGFGSSSTGGVLENRTVSTVTLDSLLAQFPPPNVMKIDIEGAEAKVMRGGEKMLETVRPLIYCEISGQNIQTLHDILTKFSYRFLSEERFASFADFKQDRDIIGFNTIAVPEEKIAGLAGI
jgi:FkbM family methyltransferase